jgi:hypothetical protein
MIVGLSPVCDWRTIFSELTAKSRIAAMKTEFSNSQAPGHESLPAGIWQFDQDATSARY